MFPLLSLRLRTCLLAAACLAPLFASSADATPIGPSCGTCQGSVYDLTYDATPVATTTATETWRITYTIDTAGYDGPGVYINTVAMKVSDHLVTARVIDAPGELTDWVAMFGGLNAAGCSGSGSGFDCVAFHAPITLAPAVPGPTYTWVFDVELATGALFTGTNEASVKARYVTATGFKAGALVSEAITLSRFYTPQVPEPGAATLLASAAAGAGMLRRRSPRKPR